MISYIVRASSNVRDYYHVMFIWSLDSAAFISYRNCLQQKVWMESLVLPSLFYYAFVTLSVCCFCSCFSTNRNFNLHGHGSMSRFITMRKIMKMREKRRNVGNLRQGSHQLWERGSAPVRTRLDCSLPVRSGQVKVEHSMLNTTNRKLHFLISSKRKWSWNEIMQAAHRLAKCTVRLFWPFPQPFGSSQIY